MSENSSFAAYIRGLIKEQMSRSDAVAFRLLDADDRRFLERVNRFLVAQGQTPLEMGNDVTIPEDFESVMRRQLHYKRVKTPSHPFMLEQQVDGFAHSKERYRHLSDLYQALLEYREAKDTDFNVQPAHLKLWRQEVAQGHDRRLTRDVKAAERINFAEPVIIVAPGMSTLHDNRDGLSRYFKQLELMLGGEQIYDPRHSKKTNFYSLSYPYQGVAAQEADVFAYNAAPHEHISAMVQSWVDETLLPSLGITRQDRLSAAGLKQALGKLRFYSISYGSVIVGQIRNAMAKTLLSYGYSAGQLCEALPQVYAQNVNPIRHLPKEVPETGLFSTLNVVSANDIVSNGYANYASLVEGEYEPGKPVKKAINPHTWLHYSDAPIAGINLDRLEAGDVERVGGSDVQPEYKWMVPRGRLKQQGHHSELSAHSVLIPGAHGKMSYYSAADVQNSMRWAVSGKELPEDLSQTFKPVYLVEPTPEQKKRHDARSSHAQPRQPQRA